MSAKEKSLRLFRSPPENYNCAQCIVAGFNHDELISQMQSCGGGRAPEGVCGAIYAAQALIVPEQKEELLKAFKEKNGSIYCRELKQQFRVPCPQCVASAAELLENLGIKK